LNADPTATQVVPEHDTACSEGALVPVGAGTWLTVTTCPSQCPISRPSGDTKMSSPDSAQDDVVTQEIRVRVTPVLRVRDLVDTMAPLELRVTSISCVSFVFWPAATHPAPSEQLTE
jgi:hypothetical protein